MAYKDQASYRKWFTERYKARRQYAINKLGGKCAICGTSENLEFDHINPTLKERKIDQSLMLTIDKLDKELSKCQLLCTDCHHKKTSAENKATTCKRGHPRTGLNLKSDRHCRTCYNDWFRVYRKKKAHLSQLAEETDLKSVKSEFESRDGHQS